MFAKTVSSRDAATEPTRMYSRRVLANICLLHAGIPKDIKYIKSKQLADFPLSGGLLVLPARRPVPIRPRHSASSSTHYQP